jgi:histidinol-phosphate aminotransferase
MSIHIKKHLLNIPIYERGKSLDSVKKEFGISKIYQFASNENPIGPSPKAINAIDKYLKNIHRYPDSNATNLRNKLAAKFKIEQENIMVGNGAAEIIDLIVSAFVNPKDEVLLSDPTFPKFELSSKKVLGRIIKIKMTNYLHDYKTILKQISPNTKLIFIDTPNNPVGCKLSKEEQEFLIHELPDHVILVLDEAYREFVDENECIAYSSFVNHKKNILFLRTFSKGYGLAGLRIGYLVGHQETISDLNRIREIFNVNSLALVGANAALDDELHLQKTISMNQKEKDFLYHKLDILQFDYQPSYANFILIDTKRPLEVVNNFLLKNGVIVRPKVLNGFEKCQIRVSIGQRSENEVFIETMKKLKEEIPENDKDLLLKKIG